jgi:C1A family cysteine protease
MWCCTPKKHGLGWIPDLPDQRDKIFTPTPELLAAVPTVDHVDLRAACPEVYNQGVLGSCTANALAAAFDFDRHLEGKPFMTPSRLFIYWNERFMEGSVDTDSGARLRDGIKSLRRWGTPPERDWPYDIDKFRDKPNKKSYEDAEKNQVLEYQRIVTPHHDQTRDMLACLHQGYPFVTGISVYESFESEESNRTGRIPLPARSEQLLGGHAVLVVGYDRKDRIFICRNSWGAEWGDNGYFYLPFDYLTNKGLANDMWMVRTVEV